MARRLTLALVIHGGAGVPYAVSTEQERAAKQGLTQAVQAGYACLAAGQSALDAVEAAVRAMEDNPHFNAGIGGALTSEGHVEHDAALMDGATRRAGAVTGTRRVKNPVSLARKVPEDSLHVCLNGAGAEDFARQLGWPLLDPALFITERRVEALQRVKEGQPKQLVLDEQDLHGTVGAVALDGAGHLAAATSTGGRTNKWPGRVGDTPTIGAGTYADTRTVAVSCTGNGEYFMRCVTAYRVVALVELAGQTVEQAARQAMSELQDMGGTGGLLALNARGEFAMPFNTRGMYRAIMTSNGQFDIMIL